jgi:hypothetical protein
MFNENGLASNRLGGVLAGGFWHGTRKGMRVQEESAHKLGLESRSLWADVIRSHRSIRVRVIPLH